MSDRYLWVVEKGWIADEYARRKLHFTLGSSLHSLPYEIIGNDPEVEPGSLGVVGVDTDSFAWEVRPGPASAQIRVLGALYTLMRSLVVLSPDHPSAPLKPFLEKWSQKAQDMMDRELTGKETTHEEWRGLLRTMLAAVDELLKRSAKTQRPVLQVLRASLQRDLDMREMLSDTGWVSPHEPPSAGAEVRIRRPFSETLSNVSSLEELREVLPPFTEGVGPTGYAGFEQQRRTLTDVRDMLLRSRIPPHLAEAALNVLLAESGNSYRQVTSLSTWGFWVRTSAFVSHPIARWFGHWEDWENGKPEPWERDEAKETIVAYDVVFGLFGLAYHDLLAEYVPSASPRCPTCGRETTLARGQHRDRLCDTCRADAARARSRRSKAKKATRQSSSPLHTS